MSALEQLDYVHDYLKPYSGTMNNLGDVYMSVFWPAAIGENDDYILFIEGEDAYYQNENLDINCDGYILRGEAVQFVLDRRDEYDGVN